MRRGRGILISALAALSAIVLSACAGLPTSGPVNEGLSAQEEGGAPDLSFIPDRPQPGATPEEIVEGFIRAGSGPAGGWSRAFEFLAPGTEWNPNAGVIIDVSSERNPSAFDSDSVTMTVATVATVDDRGAYEPSEGGTTPLPFELARQADGEWRITDAPDGIVLDRDVFTSVFRDYSLMYFDPTWTYLVPDVRWFATTNIATRITDALVNKPRSDWLIESVSTAFPDEVTASPAVPVASGLAEVTLSSEAGGVDQTTLNRMQTQLEASLAGAGITSVDMRVGNASLSAETVITRRTTVTGPPLVQIEQGFGFLVGDDLSSIPGLSAAMDGVAATSVQVSPNRDAAAVRLTDGMAVRVGADGSLSEVDSRADLADPSIDPQGVIWSVPRSAPQSVIARLPDGRVIQIADAWPDATHLDAMVVSRDGTRIAALVTSGGRTAVWIAGVIRGTDMSAPARLSDPVLLGTVLGTGVGLAWLDDTTVGALSTDAGSTLVLEQLIGGPGSPSGGPDGVTSIAGGSNISSVRLRGEDGKIYVKRGANWQETVTDVLVLATQQGMPE